MESNNKNMMAQEGRNIRLIVAYDGTNYHGWQRQNNDPTIQAVIEDCISKITNERICLIGSGRTDSGVHALGQVCNFRTSSNIEAHSLKKAINSMLPPDIFVKKVEDVPLDFHSRYSAKSKIYEYRVLNREDPDIFLRHYVWHIPFPLSEESIKISLKMLVGEHDFSAFKSSGSEVKNPIRNMTRAELRKGDSGLIHFVFEANGFLRHMVRNIVGTVVKVGLNKLSPEEFGAIFASRDRQKAGIKAPAQGLFLVKVKY